MKSLIVRRAAVVFAATALLAGSLTACSAEAESADGDVTVTVWARAGENTVPDQMKAFMAANPGITVKVSLVENDQYLTKFANAVRAGSVPDLVDFDIVNAPLLATQGQLMDITEQAEGLDNFSSLVEGGVQVGSLDDTIYSLPVAMTGSQMIWNKALFEQAGLDPESPPTTLAEVKAAAEKIDALGEDITGFSTIGGTGQAFTGFPSGWADGGTIFTDPGEDQEATFTSDPMVEMVEWYQDMWESGLMQPTDEPNQDPGSVGSQNALGGRVGIMFTGATMFTDQQDEFGSAAGIPGASGDLSTFVGGNQAAIPVGAKHPEEAWKILEWLVSDREAAEINAEGGWIAPDLSLATELATDAWSQSRVDALAKGKLPISIAYFAVINDPNGPWAQSSRSAIFQGADAREALSEGEKLANQLIADGYSQIG